MTIEQALAINGLYVRLMLDLGDSEGSFVVSGRVVGVVVPSAGSPVLPHLLLENGSPVSPCGGGAEVFLSDISRLLYAGEKPSEPTRPALSLVVAR